MKFCQQSVLAARFLLFGWILPITFSFTHDGFSGSLATGRHQQCPSRLCDSLFEGIFGDENEGSVDRGRKRIRQIRKNAGPPIGYNDDAIPFTPMEGPADRVRRMEMVRSLQASYYSQPSSIPRASQLVYGSTFLRNLPLYQTLPGSGGTDGDTSAVLPGYQFVWDVHGSEESHMFHELLSGKAPWYFGHVCLPSVGKENENDMPSSRRIEQYLKRGFSIAGTLMRVTDRRFQDDDGRIVITVQALEKFRFNSLSSNSGTSMYALADVELWPDEELVRSHLDSALLSSASCVANIEGEKEAVETEPTSSYGETPMADPKTLAGAARAAAIADSLRCRKFEFYPVFLEEKPRGPSRRLQLDSTLSNDGSSPTVEYLNVTSLANYDVLETSSLGNTQAVVSQALRVYWTELAKGRNGKNEVNEIAELSSSQNEKGIQSSSLALGAASSSLEAVEVMEFYVWCTLDEMIRLLVTASSSAVGIPPQMLGLLPERSDWPKEFVLEQYAAGLSTPGRVDSVATGFSSRAPFVRVDKVTEMNTKGSRSPQTSSPYSALRRANRLSYAIWLLLEGLAMTGAKPQPLTYQEALQMDSTFARLEAARNSLDGVNDVLRKMIPEKKD